jgi:hypothetical protein
MALAIFLAAHKEGAAALDQFRNARASTAAASMSLPSDSMNRDFR